MILACRSAGVTEASRTLPPTGKGSGNSGDWIVSDPSLNTSASICARDFIGRSSNAILTLCRITGQIRTTEELRTSFITNLLGLLRDRRATINATEAARALSHAAGALV